MQVVASLVGWIAASGAAGGIVHRRFDRRCRAQERLFRVESATLDDVLVVLRGLEGRVAAAEGWSERDWARFEAQLAWCVAPGRAAGHEFTALRGEGRPASAREWQPTWGPKRASSAAFLGATRTAAWSGARAPVAAG